MKKGQKKLVVIFMAIVFALGMAACATEPLEPGSHGEFVDDIALESLRGTEAEVTILTDGALNVGAGYTDIAVPNRAATVHTEYSRSPSIAVPYLFTKMLHNYNIVNNNIRLNYLDWGWGEPLMQRTTSAFLAGAGADIIIGETQMPGYAKSGYLQAFPDALANKIRATMLPASYKGMEIDGKIYGLAANPSICVLMWNKEVLKATNVDAKYLEQAPATWEEFLEVCKTVKANGKGKYFAGGVYAGDNYGGYLRAQPFISMAGGALADSNNRPVFNKTENAQALSFIREIARQNLTGALVTQNEDTMYGQFDRGKYAYLIDGSWRVSMMTEIGMNLGMGRLPSVDGTQTDNIAIGACYLSVPSYVQNPENAFKVIESHMDESVQRVLYRYGIRPVSLESLGDTAGYAEVNPIQQKAYTMLKDSKISFLPAFPNNASKIWSAFGEALVKSALEYDKDIQTLLNTAQTEAIKLA